MRTTALSLLFVSLSIGLPFPASANAFCFIDNFGFEWNVHRRSGKGTADGGTRCGTDSNIWTVGGTVTKTGRKEYDVNLTATNPFECEVECEDSFTVTGHFSRKNGSGNWSADIFEICGGPQTVSLPWTAIKHTCP